MAARRMLHYVFKVADRKSTVDFYTNVLGMQVLRHEEFEEGCKATCNGPYNGKWSKSMVGYGAEETHFVIELTYNYEIGSYLAGNDFDGIHIHSREAVSNVKKLKYPCSVLDGKTVIQSPGGYKYYLYDESVTGDPIRKVSLRCSDLNSSINYWITICGMSLSSKSTERASLHFSYSQCSLELCQLNKESYIDHGTAFGRIAIACPSSELKTIETAQKQSGNNILTPLVSLDTPGKATVEVVILGDPDNHEICFVGDEAFRQLSQMDSEAEKFLTKAINEDKSSEWFKKKGKNKLEATK